MSRLRVKCLFASVAFHGLLLLLLVVGAGFAPTRHEDWTTAPILDMVPESLIEAQVTGGGDPRGTPDVPPPAAPAPAAAPVAAPPAVVQPLPAAPQPPEPTPPKPAPRTIREPEPEPEPEETEPPPKKVTPPKRTTPAPEARKEPKAPKTPAKVEVSKRLVTRDLASPAEKIAAQKAAEKVAKEAAEKAAREAAERAAEEAAAEAAERVARIERVRQARSGQVGGVVGRLQGGLSGKSLVVVPYGPGGGGETYAGYGLYVRMIYERAWRPPSEVPANTAVVSARIVVARDGRVTNWEIVQRSGVGALDNSVRRALERVTNIGRPFPEGSKDEQKTFVVDFDLKARRGTG